MREGTEGKKMIEIARKGEGKVDEESERQKKSNREDRKKKT